MPLPKIEVPKYELTIPSSRKNVKYRPFLVREEKILLLAMEADDDKQMMGAIQDIIKECVYEDLNVKQMPIFDIEYIFLQLRAKSKGETVDLSFDCGKCKTPIAVTIDLSTIEVTIPEDNNPKIQLTDEVGVIMRYPSLEVQSIIDSGDNEIENIFSTIESCVESIWDKENVYAAKDHTKEELKDFIESLPENAFEKMQQFFNTLPVLKHEIILDCTATGKGKKKCGWKDNKTLEGLGSFFA
jgi:hypothetical protein|tara:strand:- start:425 stop:1150 length:726 start_codon:yes stop_codon:yes gene_type:complete